MTDQQRRMLIGALTIGCDRTVAAAYIGVTRDELEQDVADDAGLLTEVQQAEASAEISNLRAIQAAIGDANNWRAAMFLLKCRSPERYDPKPKTIDDETIGEFVRQLLKQMADLVPANKKDELERRLADLMQTIQ